MDELFKDYYEEQKKVETAERSCKTCAEEDNYEHPEYCERCIGCDRWKPKSPKERKHVGDILIRGMEMPTDVTLLAISPDGTVDIISGQPDLSWKTLKDKAVPVPPHGKLVEVADVKELFEKHFGDDQIAFQLIDSVPVIIPPKSKEQQDLEDLVERLNREDIAP